MASDARRAAAARRAVSRAGDGVGGRDRLRGALGVLLDIQGVQSRAHGERGIARYLLELASALERVRPGVVGRFLVNPDLPVPEPLAPLVAAGRVGDVDDAYPGATVYHVGSPFEPVELDRLWPAWARRSLRLAVTLFDLIPDLLQAEYLDDPILRRRYFARLDLVRQADLVLALSEATAADAVERLELRPERIHVVGAAPSSRFEEPRGRRDAFERAQKQLPWLRAGFVFYAGADDPRKNLERLVEAYALLDPELRRRHQLVLLVSRLPDERERRLGELAAATGASADVRFTRFVDDDTLILLYQSCGLFVFPSLYEGFGLPIAEARACGAPVVAARTSSIVELVRDARALFDPRDPRDIARVLTSALTDRSLLAELRATPLDPRFRWPAVAERVAAAYATVVPRRPRRRRRPRLAFVTPLPPQRSGVAAHSHRLLAELARRVDVDAFVDVPPSQVEAPVGVRAAGLVALDRCERALGGYDRIVYSLGNSSQHRHVLPVLRTKPGVVLAHDVRLTSLYALLASDESPGGPRAFRHALERMHGRRLPAGLGRDGSIALEDAERYGVTMAREAVELSELFLVHSRYGAELARLDVAPEHARKVRVLPFGFPAAEARGECDAAAPLVTSFGHLTRVKLPATLLRAFASVAERRPEVRLAFVGPEAEDGIGDALAAEAQALGVRDRVTFAGHVQEAEWRRWLERTTVAVQLRALTLGEASGAIADCLAAGVPVITSDVGWMHELPGQALVRLRPPVEERDLAARIEELLDDGRRRAALAAAGQELARERPYSAVADALLAALGMGDERARALTRA